MSKIIDLTGRRFERLEVISYAGKNNRGENMWNCRCDCKNITKVKTYNLTSGNVKSCGCLLKEKGYMIKHGMRDKRIYRIYKGMKQRCLNQNSPRYDCYGGRGITICPEWLGEHGAENFIKWAFDNGYAEDLTLDRENNNKGYSPDNCRWITREEQMNNTRYNKIIEFEGEKHTIAEWSRIKEIKYPTLVSRFARGWSAERALKK